MQIAENKLIPSISIKESHQFLIKVILANAILVALSKVAIPFYPVPLSLETLAFMLVGSFCDRNVAIGASIAYLLEAFIGIPVLHSSMAGPSVFVGTTAGYILGFLVISCICSSTMIIANNRLLNQIILLAIGEGAMFTMGVAFLSLHIGFEAALVFGLFPFILGDLCKILTVAIAYKIYHRL